ncbi:MAG: hypothetical protein K5858_10435 [Lachnospiraceae bacterium]|nr:hypothetical protein [Lachnospiraceae bacterium]
MRKTKKILAVFSVLALIICSPSKVMAASTFNTYIYDEWDESVEAPDSYKPLFSMNGIQMGAGLLNIPLDFFIDAKGDIYLADSGNSRILVLNADLQLKEIIESVLLNGEPILLEDVEGLYVTENGRIYACQTSLSRVLVIENGVVTGLIEKPVSNLVGDDFVFAPTKIGIDIYGRAYVLSKGCYTGFLQFDTDGTFMSFYGANKVELTADVVFNYMWKNILSDKQRAAMTSIIPIEYSNIDCGSDGFVYSSTVGTQIPKSQIKKLNPLGNNIYFTVGKEEFNFGDEEMTFEKGKALQPAFTDVKVNSDGFIFATDLTTGRVFERDWEGNLVAVFGGIGNQVGCFNAPVAIDTYAGKVYVLDRLKGNITVFEPTEYGKLVEEAILLYDKGDYDNAVNVWKKVLIKNSNSSLAYSGIGKSLSQKGEYKESLDYLKYSGDRYNYSKAFGKNRLYLVRTYGVYGICFLLAIFIVISGFIKINKYRRRKENGDVKKEN